MDYQTVVDKLSERALNLHRVLSDRKVYLRDISETEFFQRVNDLIETDAESISTGQGAPWLTLLMFPAYLLLYLKEVVYFQSWDTEDGIDGYFESL
jgi:hypothetical protein